MPERWKSDYCSRCGCGRNECRCPAFKSIREYYAKVAASAPKKLKENPKK